MLPLVALPPPLSPLSALPHVLICPCSCKRGGPLLLQSLKTLISLKENCKHITQRSANTIMINWTTIFVSPTQKGRCTTWLTSTLSHKLIRRCVSWSLTSSCTVTQDSIYRPRLCSLLSLSWTSIPRGSLSRVTTTSSCPWPRFGFRPNFGTPRIEWPLWKSCKTCVAINIL